ncbi:MAG: phenylalanine--tRNA ligase subunit beta [Pseudomonadota bacterium]|nr:phenylalanine--tRNA ligase subunit beta [Pseudomonadota bacterium]
MKISVDWLSDFVDLTGIAPERIAEELTVRTAEVDGWEIVNRSVAGLLVAEVLRVEPLGDGTRPLAAVTVDLGGRTAETVCGAPGVRVGMKVAFAPPGTTMASGAVIAASTLHGRRSDGMLCSPAELGMGSAKDALLEIPPVVANGTLLAELVPATDMLIEIDNKSLTHRPDLWGHYGFAREFAAIFGRPLAPYTTADLARYDALPAFPIEVEDAVDCLVYSAIGLEVSANTPSPLTIQRRLLALGSTPINALVDVTNYVQLELGQPTHAFEASAMQRVRVARAGSTTSFTTLDGKTWKLQPEDLLIHNGETPVALAGIMGGQGSRVLEHTRKILLESANFRGTRVRQTASRLALRTDASLRFEKKPPPSYTRLAAGRIVHWLERFGLSPQATTRYSLVGDLHEAPRTIRIAPGWMTRRAGTEITNEATSRILGSIGFGCQEEADGGLAVSVPAFRSTFDISIPEDISEEVMRLYGYDAVTPTPPRSPMQLVQPHAPTRNHHRMRRILAQAHGFVEVETYGWTTDEWTDTLGYKPTATLDLRNPIAVSRKHMRDTLVANLLAVAHQNKKGYPTFRVFELGKVFGLDAQGVKYEEDHLAGVVVDQSGDRTVEQTLRSVRGALDDLIQASGFAGFTYDPAGPAPHEAAAQMVARPAAPHPWYAPKLALTLRLGDTVVGHLGVLPAALRGKVLDGGHAVWFSLRVRPIQGDLYPSLPYTTPPLFPESWQDFTFVWPVEQGYAGLDALLSAFSHRCVGGHAFVAVYRPKGSETANYTFRFTLRLPDATLGTQDIEDFRSAFLAYGQTVGLRLV